MGCMIILKKIINLLVDDSIISFKLLNVYYKICDIFDNYLNNKLYDYEIC